MPEAPIDAVAAVAIVAGTVPAAGASAIRERATVRTPPALRRRQRTHAALTTLVPLAGTVVAAVLAVRNGLGAIELGALGAMYFATFVGIAIGLHRFGSHRAFAAPDAVRAVLYGLGAMAAQGPPSYWIVNHRRHHALSDRDGDVHSPYVDGARSLGFWRGLWHAHVGWSFDHELTNALVFGKDLLRDRVLARINRRYPLLVIAGIAVPGAVCGALTGSLRGAALGALWGGPVRLFATYHATCAINSVAHRFGSRPDDTRDHSRNNVLLAIPTLGEGWHNNHHAFPSSAFAGLRWWQIDISAWLIRALEGVGLATDVVRQRREVNHGT
jgi:stearoyl-CoA desaturase (delta-9 desaturase)